MVFPCLQFLVVANYSFDNASQYVMDLLPALKKESMFSFLARTFTSFSAKMLSSQPAPRTGCCLERVCLRCRTFSFLNSMKFTELHSSFSSQCVLKALLSSGTTFLDLKPFTQFLRVCSVLLTMSQVKILSSISLSTEPEKHLPDTSCSLNYW